MEEKQENPAAVDMAAIRQASDQFLDAYNAADIEGVCALLTPGAVLMPPDEPVVSGADRVRSRIECFFSGFTFNLRFDVRQTEVVGPVAFERGSYAAFALLKGEEAEPRGGYGEYILLFERQPDSSWRIAAFGTAAAQGISPRNVAAPARLEDLLGGIEDPEASYWSAKWTNTLSEHLPPLMTADVRRKLYN